MCINYAKLTNKYMLKYVKFKTEPKNLYAMLTTTVV